MDILKYEIFLTLKPMWLISGKYLEVEPLGITHLEFPKSGNHYTWRKVKTVVHNIVIGKLWIDQVQMS